MQKPNHPTDPQAGPEQGAELEQTGTAKPARDQLESLLAELDLSDSHSILFFGSAAQVAAGPSQRRLDRVGLGQLQAGTSRSGVPG